MSTQPQRTLLDLSFKSPIRQLNEGNYSKWLVDIRTLLRKQKLQKYTQESAPATLTPSALAKQIESSTDAANAITPTVSSLVKQRLTQDDFNCGLKIITYITDLYRPTGDGEFIRLTKEYYTLKYHKFETITNYITHIKSLKERILATNVILTPNKQTILYFTMSLPEYLQYLTKIQAVTPNITAVKATTILLEEERKEEKPKDLEEIVPVYSMATVGKPSCKTYRKNYSDICQDKHPDLILEWL